MQIYIHRNNEDFGPYSPKEVAEYVKQGMFKASDLASYAGTSERKKLGELLGIAGASEPARVSKAPGSAPPAAAKQKPAVASVQRQPARAPGKSGQTGEKKKGSLIPLNVTLILLVAAALYIRMGGGGERARRFLDGLRGGFAGPAIEHVNDTPAPVIEKEPVAAEAPAPAPVAAATPAPPKPFDPADLAGNPGAWPKTLRLKQSVEFPAMYNSQVVGKVMVPPGTAVQLVNMRGDQLVVDYQGGTQTIFWKLTDLEEEVAKSGAWKGH